MKPTIGRTVIYMPTLEEQAKMNDQKNCNIQDQLPATIVAVFGDHEEATVNLKVHLDGEGDIWATSVLNGVEPGEWKWPEIKN